MSPMNPRLMRPLARRQAPPTDPYFASVSLLLHFDGAFTDSSGDDVAVTTTGDVSISTTTKKFGTGSAYFDGNSDYLVVASDNVAQLGAGDFTVEMWAYPLTLNGYTVLTGNFSVFANNEWQIIMNGSGGLSLFVGGDGFATFSVPLTTNAWQHIALVRHNGDITLYLDGVSGGTWENSKDFDSPADLWIGRAPENETNRWFDGYIDEYRITKGVARYTANFTPPTAAFPNL